MKACFIFCMLLAGWQIKAQDSLVRKSAWQVSGYVKNLESLSFDKNFKNAVSENLLHQRLNIRWRPSQKISAVAEFRNRLFWGEGVKSNPGFANQVENENENFNLQKTWINNGSLMLHTSIERLNLEYRDARIEVKVGRQRINWGLADIWNPNDIFNVYSFLNFDYEERAGADGIRGHIHLNNAANLEVGYVNTGKENGNIAAIKYEDNISGYDWQCLAGWHKNRLTLGGGWAGILGKLGFKGEGQWFLKRDGSESQINITLEFDHILKKGWYVKGGLLYNNNGMHEPIENGSDINFRPSALMPMPTRWNFIATTAKEINPLCSATVSLLFAPGTDLIIVLPSIKYNLASNLDADIFWQSFFLRSNEKMEAKRHLVFFRIKWSF